MDTDQREYQVCVSISDDGFYNIEDVQFTEEDIYVNIEDNLFGSLDALKTIDGDNFDIENYKLRTPKVMPFLWDGL